MSILLLEDEKEISNIYAELLSINAFSCKAVYSATEALDVIGKEHFSMLILDLMLPDMDGFEFLKKVNDKGLSSTMNIVVITNMGSGFNRQELSDMGVSEVLLKLDVGPGELLDIAKRYDAGQG